jgi:hypothetical protein
MRGAEGAYKGRIEASGTPPPRYRSALESRRLSERDTPSVLEGGPRP